MPASVRAKDVFFGGWLEYVERAVRPFGRRRRAAVPDDVTLINRLRKVCDSWLDSVMKEDLESISGGRFIRFFLYK